MEATKLLLIITGIGLLNTIYLSYHVFTRKAVSCWFLPDEWCQKVQFSKYSKTFGIPNPFLGFMMLAAIFIGIIMVQKEMLSFKYIYGIISIGFLFSVYFMYIQAAVIKAFCTWCILSFVVFTSLFYIATRML